MKYFLCTISMILLIGIVGAIDPVASFTSNNTNGSPPLVINFTDTSINEPTSWQWAFGDNQPPTDYFIKWNLDIINASGWVHSSNGTKYDGLLFANESNRPHLTSGVQNLSLKFNVLIKITIII